MTATLIAVLVLAALVALVAVTEAQSRRRVRPIQASEVERVPYATFHTEEDGQ
jgi:hypothetical protein